MGKKKPQTKPKGAVKAVDGKENEVLTENDIQARKIKEKNEMKLKFKRIDQELFLHKPSEENVDKACHREKSPDPSKIRTKGEIDPKLKSLYLPQTCENCELEIWDLEEKFQWKLEQEVESTKELLEEACEDKTAIWNHNKVLLQKLEEAEEALKEKEMELEKAREENEGKVCKEGRLEKLVLEKLKYLNGIIDEKEEELEICKNQNKILTDEKLNLKKTIEFSMENLDSLEEARKIIQDKLEELEESREEKEESFKKESLRVIEYLEAENIKLREEKEFLKEERMKEKENMKIEETKVSQEIMRDVEKKAEKIEKEKEKYLKRAEVLKLKLEQQRSKLKESFMKCNDVAVVKVVSEFRISYRRHKSALIFNRQKIVHPLFVQRTEVNLRHFHDWQQRVQHPLISRDDYYNGRFRVSLVSEDNIFAGNDSFEGGGHSCVDKVGSSWWEDTRRRMT